MRIYFDIALLGLLASIAGWNRDGMICFSGLMLFLWLCRKVIDYGSATHNP